MKVPKIYPKKTQEKKKNGKTKRTEIAYTYISSYIRKIKRFLFF